MISTLQIQLPRKLAQLVSSHLFKTTGHKGHYGRIGVIGGSFQYTGAPYYAAISSLKSGADMSMIFCHKDAGIPIKSYSPQNMVVPLLGTEHGVAKILEWLKSVHILVVGPGLGREQSTLLEIQQIVANLSSYKSTLIGDADFLFFLSQSTDLVKSIRNIAQRVVLTPNVREFERLYQFLFQSKDLSKMIEKVTGKLLTLPSDVESFQHTILSAKELSDIAHPYFTETMELASSLNNCFVFRKGPFDFITNGKAGIIINSEGSKKRCGGIGDVLTGVIASFTHQSILIGSENPEEYKLRGLAGASLVTRLAARSAELKKGISLVAPDIIEELGSGVSELMRRE